LKQILQVGQVIEQLDRDGSGAFDESESPAQMMFLDAFEIH